MWVLSYEESGKITEVFRGATYDEVYDEMVLLIKLFLKPDIPYLRHNIFEKEKKIQVDFGNYTRFFWIGEEEKMNYEDQKKFDELNQKWLDAIRDWKKIIAKKDQELALYKKALELACGSVAKHEKRVDEEMGIIAFFGETFDYDVNEFIESFLQQAKEEIDEQEK